MTPAGFDSWRSFWSMATAREFFDLETKQTVKRRSCLEVTGSHLSAVLLKPLDAVMKEFRNPVVIVALTVSLIFIASIVFYPAQTFGMACRILPFLKAVRPHHVKAALYFISQIAIGGIGLRMFGRLSNHELMQGVRSGRVMPVPIGSVALES